MKQITVLALVCSACAFVAEGTGESGSSDSSSGDAETIGDQSATTTATTTTGTSASTTSSGTDVTTGDTDPTSESTDDGSESDSSTGDPVSDYALSFTGMGGASTDTLPALPESYTIEYWLHTDGQMHGTIVSTFTGGHGWWFFSEQGEWTDYDDVLVYIDYNASDWYYVVGDPPRDLNAMPGWHHIAATKDDSGLVQMFVDGGLVEARQFTTPFATTAAPLWLGINDAGGLPLSGAMIDKLVISQTVRYETDFEPSTMPEADADTLYLWTFDEGEGTVSYDQINEIPLVITGATWAEL